MKNDKHRALCPICKKTSAWEGNPFRPFCSERCRLIDLGNWASEDYRIPGAGNDKGEVKKTEKEK